MLQKIIVFSPKGQEGILPLHNRSLTSESYPIGPKDATGGQPLVIYPNHANVRMDIARYCPDVVVLPGISDPAPLSDVHVKAISYLGVKTGDTIRDALLKLHVQFLNPHAHPDV